MSPQRAGRPAPAQRGAVAFRLAALAALAVPAAAGAQEPSAPAPAPAARAAAAPFAAADETAELVEVRLGRYAVGSVPAVRADTALLVSARAFLALTGVRLRPELAHGGGTGATRWVGTLHPGRRPVTVDPAARVLRVGTHRVTAGPGEARADARELYLALPLLARAAGVRLRYEAAEGVVLADGVDELPVARRARHAADRAAAAAVARERQADPDAPVIAGHLVPAYRTVVDYTVTRWQTLAAGTTGVAGAHAATTGAVGVAVPAGGGVLTTYATVGGIGRPGNPIDAAWTWNRPAARRLRTVRVGAAQSDGLRPVALLGAAISNAAPVRDVPRAPARLTGAVPHGWTVEAYHNGGLLGADSAGALAPQPDAGVLLATDAAALPGAAPGGAAPPAGADAAAVRRFALTVPVHPGETTLDLVALGPEGEVRRTHRLVQAMPMNLPTGAFEYRLAAGACRPGDLPSGVGRAECRGRATADLRYGLSARWAVRGGVDGTWLRAPSGTPGGGLRPYVAVAGGPWDALTVTAEHAPGQLDHLGVRVQPSPAVRLSAARHVVRDLWVPAYAVGAPATAGTVFTPRDLRWQRATISQGQVQFVVAPERLHGVVFQAHELRREWASGHWAERRVGVAGPARVAELRAHVRRETMARAAGRTLVGAGATVLPVGALAPVLGRTWLTGLTELTPTAHLARAELSLARPLGGRWRVDLRGDWDRRLPGTRGVLAVTSQLPTLRAAVQTSAGGRGLPMLSTQTVSGSAMWNQGGHELVLAAEPSLDRGGIAGRVFLDLDADGRRDPGEPGIPHAQLHIAAHLAAADAHGAYRLLGLPPETVVRLTLDSASLASPWWVPGAAHLYVRTAASRVVTVDYPVVVGAVVNGRVDVAGGPAGLAVPSGTEVVFEDVARGTRHRTEVLSDGTFTLTGLPPGRFAARVALAQTGGKGAWRTDLPPVVVDVPGASNAAATLDAAGPVVDGVRLMLTRRADLSTEPPPALPVAPLP